MRFELIFAEIGDRAYPVNQDHFRSFFPEAPINIITEAPSFSPREHARWGWRMNDYYKVWGLVHSKADVAVAFDADMRIVSKDVQYIEHLAKTFGLCLPANPRKLVKVDNEIGADAQVKISGDLGLMYAVNCGIIALCKENKKALECAETFLKIMEATPMRGPMAWAKAFDITDFFPCLLPPQWCVCQEDIGCGNEIVLHAGHAKVKDFYAV